MQKGLVLTKQNEIYLHRKNHLYNYPMWYRLHNNNIFTSYIF